MKSFMEFAGIIALIVIVGHVATNWPNVGGFDTGNKDGGEDITGQPLNAYHQVNGNGVPGYQKTGGLS